MRSKNGFSHLGSCLLNRGKLSLFKRAALLLILSSVVTTLALQVPTKPKGRINDYANLLTTAQISALEDKLRTFEETTSNQIAVAIFPSLEGESLEDFTIRLAEKWKIGTKLRDNGLILAVFVKEKKMRIEVGYGLEATVTDAQTTLIRQEVMGPKFRTGDYYGGLEAGLNALMNAAQGSYPSTPRASRKNARRTSRGISPFLLLALFFFVLPVIISQFGKRRRWYNTFGAGGWSSGGWGAGGGGSGGGFSGGGGGFGGGGSGGDW